MTRATCLGTARAARQRALERLAYSRPDIGLTRNIIMPTDKMPNDQTGDPASNQPTAAQRGEHPDRSRTDSELFVEQIQIGPMQNFTYVLGSNRTREVVLVDPAWEIEGLLEHVHNQDFKVTGALITHYHPDHCGGGMGGRRIPGITELLEHQRLKIYVHKLEAEGLKRVTGVSDTDLVKVESGDELSLGDVAIEFLHTPGHTPGSQCFRCRHTLISGDTLFIDGCGRVDLPGSNPDDMYRSLQNLSRLPDDTLLLPGHNYGDVPNATLASTKQRNPYLRVSDLQMFRQFMGVHESD